KQFFFFALQGIRRQYAKVETVFLAHAAQAWEFDESQFFQASSSGGTVTSSVARLALDVMATRSDPSRYNVYFFYASDGENAAEIESLAQRLGLDYYPVDFEMTPASLMTEIAVYGLPVRMPHWSFGVRYIHQLVRQSMGHSKIFEVMFPGDPCRAFLMDGNSTAENALVTAHVLGHADFAKNNQLFARFHAMAGGNIVETAAAHARRIQQALESAGMERV